ncbi:MAG: HEXXH motif-containing putative peptide modification protein [Pyrinomonadaceae bacterium]
MLTRDIVVEEYFRASCDSSKSTYSRETVQKLPPALCRSIALDISDSYVEAAPFTGADDAFIDWLFIDEAPLGFYVGKREFPVISDLPLDGHEVSILAEFAKHQVTAAIKLLGEINEEYLSLLRQWTSLIVWLDRKNNFPGTLLTSSTFPNFPHCTFVTHKSMQHIPPNNVLGFASSYALAENLFHEALHQQLAALLLHRDILTPTYSSETTSKIDVPWRGGAWEPDRVFHATYVYSKVLLLRQERFQIDNLNPVERQWLERAIIDGTQALNYLRSALKEYSAIFTPNGSALLDAVLTHAAKVCSKPFHGSSQAFNCTT